MYVKYNKYLLSHIQKSVEDKESSVLEDAKVISKNRVAIKLKKIRQDYKKAPDVKRKSGGGRVVFVFYDIWRGSPAVTSS